MVSAEACLYFHSALSLLTDKYYKKGVPMSGWEEKAHTESMIRVFVGGSERSMPRGLPFLAASNIHITGQTDKDLGSN